MADVDPQLLERLKVILRRDLKLGAEARIADDMAFFGEGTDVDLDSLDMLLLVTSVEREFGVKIPNEAVGRTVFESVKTLAQYIADQGANGQSVGVAAQTGGMKDPLEKLPHREPFRFVSRVTELKAGESAEGVWSVAGTEAFFAGHFPGRPLVPGVLIAEALAQISGIAGSGPGVADEGKLAHVDVRFEQAVSPPAEVVLKSRLIKTMGALQQFEVMAEVGGSVVARGNIALVRG
ncbi:MAG TPA: 3-hydroxyacyl-ACP dehydratase FabZ family protein [Tepidisphaeraceae bacterium]|jgi:3-hydroxyacyl-[acyl-carrier-protein] dehydratase